MHGLCQKEVNMLTVDCILSFHHYVCILFIFLYVNSPLLCNLSSEIRITCHMFSSYLKRYLEFGERQPYLGKIGSSTYMLTLFVGNHNYSPDAVSFLVSNSTAFSYFGPFGHFTATFATIQRDLGCLHQASSTLGPCVFQSQKPFIPAIFG